MALQYAQVAKIVQQTITKKKRTIAAFLRAYYLAIWRIDNRGDNSKEKKEMVGETKLNMEVLRRENRPLKYQTSTSVHSFIA